MNRKIIGWIAAIVLGLLIVAAGINMLVDLMWFQELEAEGVYWTRLMARGGIFLACWLFLFAFLWINLLATRREIRRFPNLSLREKLMAGGFMRFLVPRRLNKIYLVVALVLSFLLSLYTPEHWMDLLQFIHATPFQQADPIFHNDLSLYVFKLPFYRFLYGYLMMALAVPLILVGLIYLILNPPTRLGQRLVYIPSVGLGHVSALLAGILGLKAWGYRLQQLELLLSKGEKEYLFGAGYTDVHVRVPVLNVLMVLAALVAAAFLVNAFLRRPRLLLYGVLAIVGASLLGGILPGAVQKLMVDPSEFAYEKEYIAHNITFTRRAYGLDRFSTRQFAAAGELSWADLQENPGTMNNVRLWDYRPLLTTLNQLQALRQYYRFVDVDVDRYQVGEDYRQVMLSARELDKSLLSSQAQTWVNMHLQYTHGYGIAVSPVTEVTSSGNPIYFVQDVPVTAVEGMEIEEPSIYYGETTGDYVIVKTRTREFHYGTTDGENVYTTYQGKGGIPLNSLWRRLLFALKFGDYRILISGELTGESRIMFDRQIKTRITKLAPFLQYDEDPYIVLSQGRLFWIQDAYAVTDRYPYSAPLGRINYIRNSVKAVVDAYHGSVDFYLMDPEDPLAETYRRIFPDLFRPREEMPEGLVQHLRYPEGLFNIQSRRLTLYHSTDPNIVYTSEDLWNIPLENDEQPMEPYYTILQLPGYEKPEFVLILPFTPARRDNMIAWMVARCDGANYGKGELFLFPKGRITFGPRQIKNLINQDTVITEQLTLWDQHGSRVIRGNLLVLPINDSVLYVEPIFLESEGGGVPQLSRVIVVHGETVVMEESLEQALARLFGGEGPLKPGEPDPSSPGVPEEPGPGEGDSQMASLARRSRQLFEEALERQREGDWAGYGSKIEELGRVLQELERLYGGGEE